MNLFQYKPRIVMRGQILKRNDGDGFFIIACDGVNMPLCVRANVIQISDAGGEIANIDCGDIPLCVQQPRARRAVRA